MGVENIVERIISDAESEARGIISDAEKSAQEVLDEANLRADRKLAGVKAEVAYKVKSILDGKAATARLDGAKLELAEKRRVIDVVYEKALKALVALDKEDTLSLADKLLQKYAEEGDEVVFASNYKYAAEVSKLGVFKDKKLKPAHGTKDFDGGFILCGKNCDKDLSYGALLALDREEHQSDIAAEVFKG